MAEVAEARQPRPALTKDRARHVQIEARGRESGPVLRVTQSQTSTAASEREPRGGQERPAPRQVGQPAEEMRRGRAHGERAHEDADREPASRAEPRGDDLHRGRIGARHAEARGEAEHERGREALDPECERAVERRARDGAPEHEDARRDDIGQVAERRAQRAQDEARLHGDGESRAPAVAELPFAREGRQDGGRAEPERERAQLGQGEKEERPPAPVGGIGHVPYLVRV